MEEVKNYNAVVEIANKHLGKVGGDGYKDVYDPELLVAVPRYLNREAYGIEEGNLPFVGVDSWNCYEVSAITKKGQPVAGMLKIVCPADTEFHVESKSIKLYLNSLNMTPMGQTAAECIFEIEQTVSRDLTELLGGFVTCTFFKNDHDAEYEFRGYQDLEGIVDLDAIEFTAFKSDASQLKIANTVSGPAVPMTVKSNLLRSNCRVTNQPDWGDVYINIEGNNIPDAASLAKYIVSHRTVSHFHEEICEMVFTHLMEAYKPEKLMVACLYTRRGGLDINPIRATHKEMLPGWFEDSSMRMKKTLRQ
jgi:7-cyano-7-deazaguanine reductase